MSFQYYLQLQKPYFIILKSPGANNIFITNSIKKLIEINSPKAAANAVSKNNIKNIINVPVLHIGASAPATTIAAFLLFIFL